MKELTALQIGAVAGHPGSPVRELRLLLLYLSDAGDRVVIEPETKPEPLGKAA